MPLYIHEMGQRQNQEDAFYPQRVTPESRIFVLCDGMGGHEHGEVASQSVAHVIGQYLETHTTPDEILDDKTINDALEAAFTELDRRDDGNERKMGTTLCIVAFHKGGATMAHIGDSRIYHVRTAERKLLYMSRDHSLVMDLYRAGEIDYEEMAHHPQKNIITRAMQPGRENRVRIDIVHATDVKPGDYFYICSDGMLEEMSNEELCEAFCSGVPDEKLRALLTVATRSNRDNHTAWILHVDSVTAESGDETLADDERTSNVNALRIIPVGLNINLDVSDSAIRQEEDEADVKMLRSGSPNRQSLIVQEEFRRKQQELLVQKSCEMECRRQQRRKKPNYVFLVVLVALCAVVLGAAACFFLMGEKYANKPDNTIPADTAYLITDPARYKYSKEVPEFKVEEAQPAPVPAKTEVAPTPQEEPAPTPPEEQTQTQQSEAPATVEKDIKEKIKKKQSETTRKDNENAVSL